MNNKDNKKFSFSSWENILSVLGKPLWEVSLTVTSNKGLKNER